ncbi:hypothetical protein [Pedobacter sp. P26]|uniref:hypothetical protein n=1 Tax=Pedobacter sp. P26 TaxID=3423956 RepID=UPI003D67B5C0
MTKKTEIQPNEATEDVIIEDCFIITPIGAAGSDTFVKAMGLIDAVIEPVLAENKMKALPANRMDDLGSINKQLIKRIVEDRLVIANLTGLNPNVMYELAIRHAARKPVIIMAEQGTRLPFDITDQRTIFYSDTLSGVEQAKSELRNKIVFALADENPDNPIYSYLESAKLFRDIKDDDPIRVILEKLDKLDNSANGSSSSSSGVIRSTMSSTPLNSSSKVKVVKIQGDVDEEDEGLRNMVWNAVYRTLKKYDPSLTSIGHPAPHTFEATVTVENSLFNSLFKEFDEIGHLTAIRWIERSI